MGEATLVMARTATGFGPCSWDRRKDGGADEVAPTIGREVWQVLSHSSFGQKLRSLPAALWDFECPQSS